MPHQPASPCRHAPAGCPNLQPCPSHPPRPPWAGSTRRTTLPKDWRTRIRPTVLDRDPWCQCPGCPRCQKPGTLKNALDLAMLHGPTGQTIHALQDYDAATCARASAEVDHIGDRNDHRLRSLRGLCTPCHRHRSSSQGGRA